jgi:hypothetical protein
MFYDIIIIGAGIAGLYAAYKIKKSDPKSNILIIEAESHVGGRAGTYTFNGVNVTSGAGVGRKSKDVLLTALLNELGIKFTEFPVKSQYSSTIHPSCFLKKTFLELRSKYNPKTHGSCNFREFATLILGKERYENFVTCSGYSDYESENAYDTLYNYGFDDNYQKWTALGISWKDLIRQLVIKIGKNNIVCNSRVSKINPVENAVQIFANGKKYECQKAIIATTIDCLRAILPGANSKTSQYRQIHGQPFLRIYGKFNSASIDIMKQFCPSTTVVPGPLHKLIPMDSTRGVYMIAYTDNKGATVLEKFAKDNDRNRAALCRILEVALGIPIDSLGMTEILPFYWKEGTHYYDSLSAQYKSRKDFIQDIQHPYPNVLVIGEMASMKKGWVEGALESVENIL